VRFGSVCSGIEAASVAWHPLGWKAAWLSEIEPFPSAVLAHHYPDVPNLGDMTTLPERILSGEVEAPDLFCGGTPCQAFSVAGLRNSLDDARGNLSLTFVGIANAIDHVRSVRRDAPGIIFWENVPGVLSTKDNAFGCFLAALAGEDDPIIPSGEKWTNAGCVYGPQRAVAWRVLDAQYFGVAQRRRRVFVVASARDDFDPTAVLFEFDSVRRDTAPSREKGEKPTASLVPSVTGSLDTECGGGKLTHQSVANGHLIGTITARMFNALGTRDVQAGAIMPVVSPALNTCSGSHHAPDTKAYVVHGTQDPCVSDIAFAQGRNNGGENVLMQPISIQDVRPVEKAQNGKGWNDDGTAYTVDTHATQGVAQPIPLDMMNIRGRPSDDGRANRIGRGYGEVGDPMFTITKANHHAVAQPINIYGGNKRPDRPEGGFYVRTDEDTSKTLDAATGLNPTCSQGGTAVMQSMQVRRLTPVECERLQGFPDGYTNIAWRKKAESPDGPRYKALGNSWAVPVVAWIGHRIQQEINK
jgi:DNA (cytosine-5)-methyltransferase 1